MVLYVRSLDQSEERWLQDWLRSHDDELEHRARVILLSSQGYRIPEIGEMLGAHPANLRKWIHRFNEDGLRGLQTVRAGGAKPRFSDEQKARIVELANSRPRDLGLSFTSWTLHKLAEQARKRRIVERISHEYVRQILMDANCAYRDFVH
jgi:transposase